MEPYQFSVDPRFVWWMIGFASFPVAFILWGYVLRARADLRSQKDKQDKP